MQIDREQIIRLIKLKGPILPVELSNELKQSTIIIGAVLSELVKSNKIKISNLKVGGSPVYFLEEQKHKLQEYKKHLNEKDQRAYELLREKRVLRDKSLSPLMRVCLRQIKDFAVPLVVNIGGKKEIFWKWYLTNDNDAKKIIQDILGINEQRKEEKNTKEKADKEKQTNPEQGKERQEETIRATAKTEERENKAKSHGKEKREVQKKIVEIGKEKKPEEKGIIKKEKAKGREDSRRDSRFYLAVADYFKKKKIEIIKEEIIRKSSDLEFIIKIPSSVGMMRCFCKAKKKKRINEADLAAAYVKAQFLNLPLVYISTGKLTKKAKESLGKEVKNVKFTIIELA